MSDPYPFENLTLTGIRKLDGNKKEIKTMSETGRIISVRGK